MNKNIAPVPDDTVYTACAAEAVNSTGESYSRAPVRRGLRGDRRIPQGSGPVKFSPYAQPLAVLELGPSRPSWRSLNMLLQFLGAVLGLGGQYLINEQNSLGFVMWLGANASLAWLQLRMRLRILVLLHTVYFALCVQGLLNWSR